MADDKVECRTPAEGRDGVTRIPRWKYDAVREAIRDVLGGSDDEGFPVAALKEAVGARLSSDTLDRLGSLGWHVTVVKLNMEFEGEVRRIPKVTPQRIMLA